MGNVAQKKLGVSVLNSEIKLKFSSKIYELEAVMNACYNWVENYYIYFEPSGKDSVSVSIRAKNTTDQKDMEHVAGELQNQLLAESLRLNISVRNKGIRQAIVKQAISSALSNPNIPDKFPEDENDEELVEMNKELEKILKEAGTMSYLDDPLNIGAAVRKDAVPQPGKNAKKEVCVECAEDVPGKKKAQKKSSPKKKKKK